MNFDFDAIRPGDRVTILTPHRQEISGRAVMFNRAHGTWVLNCGGRHGTPAVASAANFVRSKASRDDAFRRTAAIINGGARL